jgi:hypothetical protein
MSLHQKVSCSPWLPYFLNASPSLAAGGVSQNNPKARITLQKPKVLVSKMAEDASTKSNVID